MRNSIKAFWPARIAVGAAMILATGLSFAQSTWPSKPVQIIVPYGAGGGVDVVARVLGQHLSVAFSQPVLVINKPGAGGQIGATFVARSAPDGLTILMTSSNQATGPALFKHLGYDPVKDVMAIAGVASAPSVLVTSAQSPVKTLQELVALAKSRPGQLNFGSTGVGSSQQLGFEMFKKAAQVDMVHVPYNGDAKMMPALIANDIQAALLPIQVVGPLVKAGRLRALAVSADKRFWALPDVPTVAEGGVEGFEYYSWIGLYVPSGTPRDVVDRINNETVKILRSKEFVEKQLPAWGTNALVLTADQAQSRYLSDIERFKRIVAEAGIPPLD